MLATQKSFGANFETGNKLKELRTGKCLVIVEDVEVMEGRNADKLCSDLTHGDTRNVSVKDGFFDVLN